MRWPVVAGTGAGAVTVAGLAVAGYASVVERNWFALRRYQVPVLAPGVSPLRLLHISDTHLAPGRHRLMSWIRALSVLEPDLVIGTGDFLGHPDAVTPLLDALGPLLDRPGAFVFGSNDFFAPRVKNPARYLWRTSALEHRKDRPDLPWRELGERLESAGWLDLNNRAGRIKAGHLDIQVAGVADSHAHRDRYERIAGPADASADLRLGVMHTPEPSVMDRFTADGYDLLLAGHTHGGQICLPVYGALVTNCGIERARVKGLHHHPAGPEGRSWLHVSAGLGTSPAAPARLSCRPEASLLTLVPRIG